MMEAGPIAEGVQPDISERACAPTPCSYREYWVIRSDNARLLAKELAEHAHFRGTLGRIVDAILAVCVGEGRHGQRAALRNRLLARIDERSTERALLVSLAEFAESPQSRVHEPAVPVAHAESEERG